jgi:hypothetical protein
MQTVSMVMWLLVLGVLGLVGTVEGMWGFDAHYVTAVVAQERLSARAASRVASILGNERLQDICTWADEVRSQSQYSWSSNLHFVNPQHDPVDNECSFSMSRDCDNNFCVVGAVLNYTDQLDRGYGNQEEALKFLTHFVADMHQPLHVCGVYTGGNSFTVKFYGSNTNLHSLLDTGIPTRTLDLEFDGRLLSYSEDLLDRIYGEWSDEIPDWIKCNPSVNTTVCPEYWASQVEPINCSNVYKGIEIGDNLTDDYYEANKDVISKLLAQAGVRLAAVLNEIL